MPQFDAERTPGVVIDWPAAVGDRLEAGQVVCRVECEKTLLELETFEAGILLATYVDAGQAARPHTLLAVIGQVGAELAEYEARAKAERADAPPPPRGNGPA